MTSHVWWWELCWWWPRCCGVLLNHWRRRNIRQHDCVPLACWCSLHHCVWLVSYCLHCKWWRRLLVLLHNRGIAVFVSRCLWLVLQIGKRWHWLDIVVCCWLLIRGREICHILAGYSVCLLYPMGKMKMFVWHIASLRRIGRVRLDMVHFDALIPWHVEIGWVLS